jgi:hypothetical protein
LNKYQKEHGYSNSNMCEKIGECNGRWRMPPLNTYKPLKEGNISLSLENYRAIDKFMTAEKIWERYSPKL